jgi:hypothetical protein
VEFWECDGSVMVSGILGVCGRENKLSVWAELVFGGLRYTWRWQDCVWVEILKLIFFFFGGLRKNHAA